MISLLKKLKPYSSTNCAHTMSTYEDALRALTKLQSNAAYKATASTSKYIKFLNTEQCLIRSGMSVKQIDQMSIIHVAGTKGKGSTCAFAESILRHHGFTTGFFSSPHLVTVRERIRINGEPISKSMFTEYFWKVYKKLDESKQNDMDMPMYFKFLTILMFHIFYDLKLDVIVVEVGIGGELDSTNIIRCPVCVGITSLGLEHTAILGDTIQEIAHQKAGIFKYNTVAYTVPQKIEALDVLRKRAKERKCSLHIVPPLQAFGWKNLPNLIMTNNFQQNNVCLAMSLAATWIQYKTKNNIYAQKLITAENITNNIKETNMVNKNGSSVKNLIDPLSLLEITESISSCKWPGRMQILNTSVADFYLDGAHTLESIEGCIAWFGNVPLDRANKKYLIFNITGNRNSACFLSLFKLLNFQRAYFVPNIAGVSTIDAITNSAHASDSDILKCKQHCVIWGNNAVFANNIVEILESLKEECVIETKQKPQILVTGSLHLVGAVLTVLDKNLTMKSDL
ncbi:folylpolyglutamate synthase, mitochondrial-like [Prorops nasuta]|uniref:folylpolyglutamate synthase, mitochondrial-like n=1 Tax=Prorops nasuta TaxID=863751 RepID=UPI0034CD5E0D